MKVAVASRSFSSHEQLRNELLKRYPEAKFNDEGKSLVGEDLIDFFKGAEKVIVGLEKVDEDLLQALPELKWISKYGVGVNNIEFEALQARGLKFGWKAGVNKDSVAELTLFLMIGTMRKAFLGARNIYQGEWKQQKGPQIKGKKIGLLGLGHVGSSVAKLLNSFGCQVYYHDIKNVSEVAKDLNAKYLDLEALLGTCDVISLHIPYNKNNHFFFNQEKLRLMRKGSYLINTSRGGIVDENSLYQCLKEGKIEGAGFDVMETEPALEAKLLELSNFMLTPHLGGSSHEAILAMGRAAIEGLDNPLPLEDFLDE